MSIDRLFLLFSSGYLHGIAKSPLSAFWLGMRYDLREIGILAVLMLLLPLIPFLNPFRSSFGKKFWLIFLAILSVVAITFYVIDALHFDYLAQRLNSSILNFIPEGQTSMGMVWQTYPVIKLLLFIIVLSWIIIFSLWTIYKKAAIQAQPTSKPRNVLIHIAIVLAAGFCIFGRIDQYPLRWSDAFGLGDSRLSQLALNPFQSFFSSLSFRHVSYDEEASQKYYPMLAGYLCVDSAHQRSHSFIRSTTGSQNAEPNVVLVICESFSGYKSSMWGNPLNTTPYFNSLCKEGVFFDHCFTPHFGTARGVWATVTCIPDVLLDKTASRDPMIVDQHSIINDFNGYEKDYFIGGSTSWANIKGVLENNIDGITIHEQGSYDAEKIDVWGISDKNLFLQANEVLRKKTGPFFAVIQTSDNHRPYTIPQEDRNEVKPVSFPRDTLIKYGFQSNEELNAFRYTDYCFAKFMETAKKEKYFNNTLFVFIGDHGIRGNSGDMFPKAWVNNALTAFHVPLLFYAPGYLTPARHSMLCSQVDVLPTIAGITGITYTNTAMGRDLLHLKDTTSNTVFIIDHDVRTIVALHDKYLFQRSFLNNDEAIASITGNEPVPLKSEVANKMRERTIGFYETARYMLFHNSKIVGR
ncbi:MAG: synthase family protein [Flavipsychrobacter sp.]|jgi:phosphoglycerol transferase MdoB-like AlkP superfamily enzyme|nr:synthase family protein [Flavipsychrobacter sp.]